MMSDGDSFVEWLSAEIRRDPANPHLKRLLHHEHRRTKNLGSRPNPPDRMLDQARRRLLGTRLLDASAGEKPSPAFAIDHEVRQLINDKVIVEDLSHDAYWAARSAVIDGCMWGDYFARHKLAAEPSKAASAKIMVQDAETLKSTIDEFLYTHHDFLAGQVASLDKLGAARDALDQIERAKRPIAKKPNGTPGDPWRVGFVFGISHGWVELTDRKISSSSDRFLSFIAQGAASLTDTPPSNSDSWTSAVKTAIQTFGLADNKKSWLSRPGPAD